MDINKARNLIVQIFYRIVYANFGKTIILNINDFFLNPQKLVPMKINESIDYKFNWSFSIQWIFNGISEQNVLIFWIYIFRYPLLLERLYKFTSGDHTDKSSLMEAKLKIEDILDHINSVSIDYYFSNSYMIYPFSDLLIIFFNQGFYF